MLQANPEACTYKAPGLASCLLVAATISLAWVVRMHSPISTRHMLINGVSVECCVESGWWFEKRYGVEEGLVLAPIIIQLQFSAPC